jgi:hypothetical protein
MATRRNPFSKATKKADAEAKKTKRITELKQKVNTLHKEALLAEKAVDTAERKIKQKETELATIKRLAQKQLKITEAARKKYEREAQVLAKQNAHILAAVRAVEKAKNAVPTKQKSCDAKFKRFNNAEDRLANASKLKLPKGM